MKYKLSTGALALFILSVSIALRLCLSNPVLDYFYPYSIEGGQSIQKIHPGTWAILIGTGLLILISTPINFLNFHLKKKQRVIFQASALLFLVMALNAYNYGFSGLAYLIDTYLYAYLCLMLSSYLNQARLERLLRFVAVILAINCAVAITEYVRQSTLLPNPIQFGFFRSNALLGHPLNNALIISTLGIAALGLNFSPPHKLLIWTLAFLGLLSFGARAATGFFLIASLLYLASNAVSSGSHYKLANRAIFYTLAMIACAVMAGYVIFYSSLGASIADRLVFDESAETRLRVFDVFRGLGAGDMITGLGATQTANLFDMYLEGLNVENFWIFTLLQFGLISFIMIYGPLARIILENSSRAIAISIILTTTFIAISSTNNSLSVKTPALAIFLISLRCVFTTNIHRVGASRTTQ